MKAFMIIISVILFSFSAQADDFVYLSCSGVAEDREIDKFTQEVKNDFLINKTNKTIKLVITGLSEKDSESLTYIYKETPTQFITEDGNIAINKNTLEYNVRLLFSTINGTCIIQKPKL